MFLSTNFTYDGISNEDMGIYLVRVDNNTIEIPIIKLSVNEEIIPNKDIPYFYGINREIKVFEIQLAKINPNDLEFTYEERVKIFKWLCQGKYKEFISDDDGFIRYYILFEEITRTDMGNTQGYLTLKARLNAPYGFSPIIVQEFDISGTTIIELENQSNVLDIYYPEIEIYGGSGISLANLNTGKEAFTINGLSSDETVYIDMGKGKVLSSLNNTYRLKNCNKKWFGLQYGINKIQVSGNGRLTIRSQFPMVI